MVVNPDLQVGGWIFYDESAGGSGGGPRAVLRIPWISSSGITSSSSPGSCASSLLASRREFLKHSSYLTLLLFNLSE